MCHVLNVDSIVTVTVPSALSVNAKPPSTLKLIPVTFATSTFDTGSLISLTESAKSLRIEVFMFASSVDVAKALSADWKLFTISVRESSAAGSVFESMLLTCVCNAVISAVILDDTTPLLPEYVAPVI